MTSRDCRRREQPHKLLASSVVVRCRGIAYAQRYSMRSTPSRPLARVVQVDSIGRPRVQAAFTPSFLGGVPMRRCCAGLMAAAFVAAFAAPAFAATQTLTGQSYL